MKVAELLSAHAAHLTISCMWQNTHYVDRWRKQTDTEISAFISQWHIHRGIQTDITAEQISAVVSALRNRQNSAIENKQQVPNEMQ
jgi:hypothetical protein